MLHILYITALPLWCIGCALWPPLSDYQDHLLIEIIISAFPIWALIGITMGISYLYFMITLIMNIVRDRPKALKQGLLLVVFACLYLLGQLVGDQLEIHFVDPEVQAIVSKGEKHTGRQESFIFKATDKPLVYHSLSGFLTGDKALIYDPLDRLPAMSRIPHRERPSDWQEAAAFILACEFQYRSIGSHYYIVTGDTSSCL